MSIVPLASSSRAEKRALSSSSVKSPSSRSRISTQNSVKSSRLSPSVSTSVCAVFELMAASTASACASPSAIASTEAASSDILLLGGTVAGPTAGRSLLERIPALGRVNDVLGLSRVSNEPACPAKNLSVLTRDCNAAKCMRRLRCALPPAPCASLLPADPLGWPIDKN